jgi:hypothetical protein
MPTRLLTPTHLVVVLVVLLLVFGPKRLPQTSANRESKDAPTGGADTTPDAELPNERN